MPLCFHRSPESGSALGFWGFHPEIIAHVRCQEIGWSISDVMLSSSAFFRAIYLNAVYGLIPEANGHKSLHDKNTDIHLFANCFLTTKCC